MRTEFVVYLSSTLADLEAERELALKTIAEVGVVRTTYRADEKGAVAACTDDVRASHLYVGILGQRYGYVPAADEGNPRGKSITELEYEACTVPGQPAIPRLMFVRRPEAGIKAEHIDALSHPETAARMKDFLARANLEQVAFPYLNLDEFRAELRIRVREHADRFHRARSGDATMFGGHVPWRQALAPVRVACLPGTDEAVRAALAAHGGERIVPFELSPDDARWLATLDDATRRAQRVALLVTPASMTRLARGEAADQVTAGIAQLLRRCGIAPLLALGVDPGRLPPAWSPASTLALPPDALDGGRAAEGVASLDAWLQALPGGVTLEPRLALPYLVLAPTSGEVQQMIDEPELAFAGFATPAARALRRATFDGLRAAAQKIDPAWPAGRYGAARAQWRCFGAAAPDADAIVRAAVARLNDAPAGTRERRILRAARLLPRCYALDEFVVDRWGSRQAVEAVRDAGCLFVVDELALLHPALRAAADRLLTGHRNAIVAITPCDPAHARTDELLDELSHLRVGSVVSRFGTELDPRCEIALNSLGRVDRWLRATLPELAAGADELPGEPALLARMASELAA
jgi:hypothetical protein